MYICSTINFYICFYAHQEFRIERIAAHHIMNKQSFLLSKSENFYRSLTFIL
jgi:hypothetical protein